MKGSKFITQGLWGTLTISAVLLMSGELGAHDLLTVGDTNQPWFNFPSSQHSSKPGKPEEYDPKLGTKRQINIGDQIPYHAHQESPSSDSDFAAWARLQQRAYSASNRNYVAPTNISNYITSSDIPDVAGAYSTAGTQNTGQTKTNESSASNVTPIGQPLMMPPADASYIRTNTLSAIAPTTSLLIGGSVSLILLESNLNAKTPLKRYSYRFTFSDKSIIEFQGLSSRELTANLFQEEASSPAWKFHSELVAAARKNIPLNLNSQDQASQAGYLFKSLKRYFEIKEARELEAQQAEKAREAMKSLPVRRSSRID